MLCQGRFGAATAATVRSCSPHFYLWHVWLGNRELWHVRLGDSEVGTINGGHVRGRHGRGLHTRALHIGVLHDGLRDRRLRHERLGGEGARHAGRLRAAAARKVGLKSRSTLAPRHPARLAGSTLKGEDQHCSDRHQTACLRRGSKPDPRRSWHGTRHLDSTMFSRKLFRSKCTTVRWSGHTQDEHDARERRERRRGW